VLADIAPEMEAKIEAAAASETPAQKGGLDDKAVHDFARAGKLNETAAALSTMCRVQVADVKRAMQATDTAMIVMIIRAAGLSWSTAKAILLMPTSRHSPAPQDLDKTQKHFERLNIATAQKVVRFRAGAGGL
jgi:Uncharacterised protein conserved in bacteria (DUF2336)